MGETSDAWGLDLGRIEKEVFQVKMPNAARQIVAPMVLILSLSSCSQAPSQTSSSQSQATLEQAKQIHQLVDGALKLKKELAITTLQSKTDVISVSTESGKPPAFLNPEAIKSFTELAKLYEDKDAKPDQKNGPQENAEDLKRFFADQKECTLAFAYQMSGDYARAAEVVRNRINTLESRNQDGRKSHSLAVCYAQYADYLNHLNRGGEAQQMLAKARAIEPNHY